MPVMCRFCKKEYTTISTHNRHVREVHKEVPDGIIHDDYSHLSHRCLECDYAFVSNIPLITHLQKVHQIEFETVFHVVETFNDFLKWKGEIELSNSCSYICKNKIKNTAGAISYYYCNRSKTSYDSEKYRQNSKALKSRKSRGSFKLRVACTSQIKLRNEGNKLSIEWQKTHYGHTVQPQDSIMSKSREGTSGDKLRIAPSTSNNPREDSSEIETTDQDFQLCSEAE